MAKSAVLLAFLVVAVSGSEAQLKTGEQQEYLQKQTQQTLQQPLERQKNQAVASPTERGGRRRLVSIPEFWSKQKARQPAEAEGKTSEPQGRQLKETLKVNSPNPRLLRTQDVPGPPGERAGPKPSQGPESRVSVQPKKKQAPAQRRRGPPQTPGEQKPQKQASKSQRSDRSRKQQITKAPVKEQAKAKGARRPQAAPRTPQRPKVIRVAKQASATKPKAKKQPGGRQALKVDSRIALEDEGAESKAAKALKAKVPEESSKQQGLHKKENQSIPEEETGEQVQATTLGRPGTLLRTESPSGKEAETTNGQGTPQVRPSPSLGGWKQKNFCARSDFRESCRRLCLIRMKTGYKCTWNVCSCNPSTSVTLAQGV